MPKSDDPPDAGRKPSLSERVVQKAVRSAHRAGSLLGFTQEQENVWRQRFMSRVEHNDIGFHVPHKGEDEENMVLELEKALRTAKDVLQRTETTLKHIENDRFLLSTSLLKGSSIYDTAQGEAETVIAETDIGHKNLPTRSYPSKSGSGNPVAEGSDVYDEYSTSSSNNNSNSNWGKKNRVQNESNSNANTDAAPRERRKSRFGDGQPHHVFHKSSKIIIHGQKALDNYKNFRKFEVSENRERTEQLRRQMEKELDYEQYLLKEATEKCRESHSKAKRDWRKILKATWIKMNPKHYFQHKELPHLEGLTMESQIRLHREAQIENFPWFVLVITVVQTICFLALLGAGGFTGIKLEPTLELSLTRTWRGIETKEHWKLNNIFIGPDIYFLIRFGALYAPCMRPDREIYNRYADRWNGTLGLALGCCESSFDAAGTTFEYECSEFTGGAGRWSDTMCSQRPVNDPPHRIRPCCQGIRGECNMTTREHCDLLEGYYMDGPDDPEHCSLVTCLSELCGMGGLKADSEFAYLPEDPNQWWRIFMSPFFHQGILHFAIVIALQIGIGKQIEKTSGWQRISIIYLVSGMISQVCAGVMSPYAPHFGAEGAVASLMAVSLIELEQSWRFIKDPWTQLGQQLSVIAAALFMGTLPVVEGFTILGGLLIGFITGVILLPYVTFGHWEAIYRRVFVCIGVPCFIIVCTLVFYFFYDLQEVRDVCGAFCEYIDCVPYTENLCNIAELP